MQVEPSNRYETIKTELEATRLAFLRLVEAISGADWDRKLPGESWTARQELAHVTQIISALPIGIGRATSGQQRSILNIVPERLRRWANGYLVVPWVYRKSNRESILKAYEEAHRNLLKLLQALPEEAWSQGAVFPSEYRTVEEMAHRPTEHFQEHDAHLRRVLGIK